MRNSYSVRALSISRISKVVFYLGIAAAAALLPLILSLQTAFAADINPWWPTDGAHMTGTQPFKAMIPGLDVSQYAMTWSVDGGEQNQMWNSYQDYQHKEASVDVTSWTWHGSGPYVVTFTATQNGSTIASRSLSIYVDNGLPTYTPPPSTSAQTQSMPVAPASSSEIDPTLTAQVVAAPAPVVSVAPVTTQVAQTPATIQNWWPTDGATIGGTQPFKALVPNRDVNSYTMYWQVDRGALNPMQTNTTDAPHKEAQVNVSTWNWNGSGPYTVTFIAKDASTAAVIAQTSIKIYVAGGSNPAPQTTTVQAQTQTQTPVTVSSFPTTSSTPDPLTTFVASILQPTQPTTVTNVGNPLSGMSFYVDPNSDAGNQAKAWQSSNPTGAAAMNTLAKTPTAIWLGAWSGNVGDTVANVEKNAKAQGQVPVLIAYNIPNRDCGGYSAGGATNDSDYKSWISSLAQGIGANPAVVILEPDGLANVGCLSDSQLTDREALLKGAVTTLKANANTKVYLDAGHTGWVDPNTIANRLESAGIAQADGFSLNVSNFTATADNVTYGTQVSSLAHGAHFVIDTSRNGNGPTSDNQWCNPPSRAIGETPTANTGNALFDAALWLKTPGESDGTCNGGPSAGVWWPDYALQLVENAK